MVLALSSVLLLALAASAERTMFTHLEFEVSSNLGLYQCIFPPHRALRTEDWERPEQRRATRVPSGILSTSSWA